MDGGRVHVVVVGDRVGGVRGGEGKRWCRRWGRGSGRR